MIDSFILSCDRYNFAITTELAIPKSLTDSSVVYVMIYVVYGACTAHWPWVAAATKYGMLKFGLPHAYNIGFVAT